MYSAEINVQILLSLLKAHGVKRMVVSPGSANASFVASAQYDKDFQLYSSVDERSAAYIACGLAEELQEPVVICCTGATASRNYVPGLTEAYYRKLPIIAVTATRPINLIGQNRDQVIDRTVIMKDIALKSVHIPVVENEEDKWETNLKINDALLETKRRGGGPVHINLTTSYDLDFSVKELPVTRVIRRYEKNDVLPPIPSGTIGIFVGAHTKWSEKLVECVEKFCLNYDAIVFCDQTSNYPGEYGVPCGLFGLVGYGNAKIDCMIHIGNISASWPATMRETWRVNPDGEVRDRFKSLTNVFEMSEEEFFEYYASSSSENIKDTNCKAWKRYYEDLKGKIDDIDEQLPFSSLWIAQKLHTNMPKSCEIHFGILNSLRCWNCFPVDSSIRGYSNTGGFGIDGGTSSLIGASFVDKEKLYYGIFGDLAFFYDLNSMGNRHIGSNVRILVANNGLGGEFKNSFGNVQKAGLGDEANEYISAYGHYGTKSPELLKHFSQDLGFSYMSASTKEEFDEKYKEFCDSKIGDAPILFEVFLDECEDTKALDILAGIGKSPESELKSMVKESTKKVVKSMFGEKSVDKIKSIVKK